MDAKTLVPAAARRRLKLLRALREARTVTADRESLGTMSDLLRAGRDGARGEPQPVRMRALDGRTVHLRPGTSDAQMALDVLSGGYHRPPAEAPPPALIWDLGSNIGLSIADMACAVPGARIVGVELDTANASLARRNLEPWADRVEVIEGAVWPDPGEVTIHAEPGYEAGVRITDGGERKVAAIPLDELLERTGAPDYVKMDIEGAEREVLDRNTEWAASVRSIKVECHGDYTADQAAADLRTLGFDARPMPQARSRDYALGMRHAG